MSALTETSPSFTSTRLARLRANASSGRPLHYLRVGAARSRKSRESFFEGRSQVTLFPEISFLHPNPSSAPEGDASEHFLLVSQSR